ncbi:MAG: DNA alkylation repair protein [Oscillospiraceae bacterium]|nr:DNA alkylation repair protein [Oscillospiraceae bacterium]
MEEIISRLLSLRDPDNAAFQQKLTPGLDAEVFLGVRVPLLRKLAAELTKNGLREPFLDELPHFYYEENLLHSILLSREKDFRVCMERIEAFLPYIDNWAVCDTLRPKVFARRRAELLPAVKAWIRSSEAYTVRFGLDTLMSEYLDEDFSPELPELAASVESEEYYVRMMVAWYFATALAKQWDAVIPYMEQHRLCQWTHRKTIQKATESFRITEEQKSYLRSLR